MPEKRAEPWAIWEPCEGEQGAEALERLADELPAFFADSTLVSCRCARLSFYQAHRLLELAFVRDHGMGRAFILDGPHGTWWLNGASDALHDVNEAESLALTESTVADYVRFFFNFLRGAEGGFVLIESSEEVGSAEDAGEGTDDQGEVLTLEAVRGKARPLVMRGFDEAARWLIDATVAYDGTLFSTSVAVGANGMIEMIDDDPISALGRLVVPDAPSLELEEEAEDSPADSRLGAPGRSLDATAELAGDREVTQAVVAVLLEDAMRELNTETGAGNVSARHFNSETQAGKPIEQLTRLLESRAIVIIESDIPFVEDVVAQLGAPAEATARSARASARGDDDLRCEIAVNDWSKLYLLSFHTYRGLFDAERAAHDLTLSDAAVLIGCTAPMRCRSRCGGWLTAPSPSRGSTDGASHAFLRACSMSGRRRAGTRQARTGRPSWFPATSKWRAASRSARTKLCQCSVLSAQCSVLSAQCSVLRDRVEAELSRATPAVGPKLGSSMAWARRGRSPRT